jgi:hypothetical protein
VRHSTTTPTAVVNVPLRRPLCRGRLVWCVMSREGIKGAHKTLADAKADAQLLKRRHPDFDLWLSPWPEFLWNLCPERPWVYCDPAVYDGL